MKCQFIRDDLEVSPHSLADLPEYAELVEKREVLRNGAMKLIPFWKRGAVLESPQVYWLVRQGVAIPADDDCRMRARMSSDQMQLAQKAYDRLAAGIAPDDYELFDDGVITGYNPDGSFKPGPNYEKWLSDQQAKEEEESEDV